MVHRIDIARMTVRTPLTAMNGRWETDAMTVPEVEPASTHWQANSLPHDLLAAKTLIYDVAAMACSDPMPELEGAEYGAHEFTVADRATRFRVAKTTPKKPGHFVTLWTRTAHGPIAPFDMTDEVDLYVISTRDVGGFGQFVFPRGLLLSLIHI